MREGRGRGSRVREGGEREGWRQGRKDGMGENHLALPTGWQPVTECPLSSEEEHGQASLGCLTGCTVCSILLHCLM